MRKQEAPGSPSQKGLVFETARQALQQNNPSAFHEAWERYRLLTRRDLPGSKPAVQFWSEVLGTAWHGHSRVPQGPARENLVQLLGLRYALAPYEGEEPLPIEEMPTMLQFAAYTAAGNRRAVEKIRSLVNTEELAVRAACLQMLDGEWEMAAATFTDCFRPHSVLLYRILHSCATPLLVFALLCTMRCDMKNDHADHWVDILQRLMPESVPAKEEDHLIAFIHNLQVAGNVLNSGKSPRYIPDATSTIACLPLALCYRGLSAALRAKITREKPVLAAEKALRHGPRLLGYYAATALLSTDAVPTPDTMTAVQHLQQEGIVPLYADIPTLTPTNALSPQVMREAMSQTPQQQDETLGWDIVLNRDTGTVTELRPILYSPQQGWWQTRDLQKCTGAIRTEQDLAGLFMISGSAGSEAALDWLAALAGHPRLRLVSPGKRTSPICLRAEKPRLRICREADFISLEPENLDYRKLRPIAPQEWAALRHSPGPEKLRRFINAYGVDGQLRFKAEDTAELYKLLSEWEEYFDYTGSLVDGAEIVPEDCRAAASVSISPQRVEIRLGIHVLPHSEKIFSPARGSEQTDVQTPTGIVRVQRDFEKEEETISRTLNACPALTLDRQLSQHTDNQEPALEGLAQLDAAGVTLLRDGRQRMRCHSLTQPYINLHTRGIGNEWFDIGGELVVDEELTLQLRELLEALHDRVGAFLPVRDGYIRLTETMERQLTTLHSLMSVKGRAPGLSTAALPAMAAALGLENLPPSLRERLATAAYAAGLDAPAELQATLRPYQLHGYRWLAERAAAGIGACLADDMGLGKTLQLIALLLHLAPKGPSLVVAPLSLQSNWERELARFAPSLRVLPFSANRTLHAPTAGEIVLASYGQLTNNLRYFSTVPWNVLALDEAQAIKNPESQRSKAVCALPAFARVCLTGTPVENSETDLWSLMRFLNPLLFGTKASFRRRFLNNPSGTRPLQDIVATLFLRRTKSEVLTELPELIEQVLPVDLSEEERAVYEAIRRHTLDALAADNDRISVLAELMRLRRACCHGSLVLSDFAGESSKLNRLIRVLAELRESGHKVLVFSQFTDVLDLVEPLLEKEKWRWERLDGTCTAAQRTHATDRFRRGKADVFLISLKAGGTGLNLTEADYVILLDPWWNPAVEAQAASRSHRMGQKNPVTLYRLIATHTIEEKILRLHDEKKELAKFLLSGASLSSEEIRLLLNE